MTLCFSNHTSQPLDSTIIAQAHEAAGELVSIPHEVYAIFEIQPLFTNKNLFQQHHSIQCGANYRAEIDWIGKFEKNLVKNVRYSHLFHGIPETIS